ncbi:MAG: TonB-dependent receptor [Thermotogae bacterium]|nr:TonB-dependent receptor [Thermotogota bacterium]
MFLSFVSALVLKGQVIDSLEGPVPFAVIRVIGEKRGTYADGRGFFSLTLPNGSWKLVVSAVGRKPDTLSVAGIDTTLWIKVVLKTAPLRTREVIITAKREAFKKETVEPFKFEAELLRSSPHFLTADILKVIQDVPGVVMATDFSSKFSVRGGGPQENIVLFDDVPVFNPYHMAGLFSVFIEDALSSFTFYRSNFPARYGGVLSSVLKVDVAEPDSSYGSASVSMLATKVFQALYGKSWGLLVAARRSYFDVTASWFGYDFPYHFYDVISKVYWNIKPTWRVSLSTLYGRDVLDFRFRGVRLYAGWGNSLLSLRSKYVLGSWINHTTLGMVLFEDRLSFGFGDQTMVSLQAPMNLGVLHTRFSYVSEDGELRIGMGMEPGWGNFEQEFFGMKLYDEGKSVSSFLYAEYLMRRGIYNLSLGLRLNLFQVLFPQALSKYNITYLNPEPRLSFRYFLTPDLALKGGMGVFHQYYVGLSMGGGQLGEVLSSFYYWTSIFRGWEPMRSLHYSLGVVGITSWGDWEVETFYKYYPYLLLENPNPDINDIYGTLFKAGRGWSYGLDGYVRKDVGDLRFLISYSFLVARVKMGDTLHPSPWDRRHAVIVSLSRGLFWDLRGGLRFTYQSGMPYTGVLARYDIYSMYDPGEGLPMRVGTREIYSLPYSLRYPPYHRLDVFLRKDFRFKRVSGYLSLSIINLYNHKNVWFYSYDYTKDPPQRVTVYQLPVFPSLELGLTW